MSKPRSLAKDTFLVLLTKIFNMSAGLIATLIIGRTLGLKGTGLYTVAFATINMINGITSLGMNRSITVLYANQKIERKTLIANALTVFFMTSLLAMIAVGVSYATGPAQREGWMVFIPALFCIPFMILIDYGNGIFLAKNEVKNFNASQMQRYAGFVAGLLLLIFVVKAGYISVTAGFLIGTICGALSPLTRLKSELFVRPKFEPEVVKTLFSLGFQFALAAFVLALNYRVAVVFLESNVSIEQVGVFGLALQLVEVLWQIPTSVATVLIGKSANSASTEEAVERSVKLLRLTLPITLVAGLVVYPLAGPLTLLFFGEKIRDAGPQGLDNAVAAIRILIPGVLFGVIYKVLSADLSGRGEPLFAAKSYAIAVVVNLVLCFVLVKQGGQGVIGAATASSAGYVVGAILFFAAYVRRYKVPIGQALLPQASDFSRFKKKFAR